MIRDTLKAAYRRERGIAMANAETRRSRFPHDYHTPKPAGAWFEAKNFGFSAFDSLVKAREEERPDWKHPGAPPKLGAYARPAEMVEKREAWLDDPRAMGYRVRGFADEIAKEAGSRYVEGNGWYCDSDSREVFRGVVLQLPARNGRPVFIAGYSEPWNDGVCVDLSSVETGEPDENGSGATLDSAVLECAKAADEFARIAAEKAREYDEAWQAASRAAEMVEEAKETRQSVRSLLAERRAMRKKIGREEAPSLCAAIESAIRERLDRVEKLRDKAEELREQYEQWQPDAWADGFAV